MKAVAEPPEQSHGSASIHVLRRTVGDEEIVERLQVGEPYAAVLLYDRYAPEVNRLIWRLLGADADHDDLVQQVFCHLLTSASKVRDPNRLGPYVLRVTVNAVRSELRKRSVRRRFFRAEEDVDRFQAFAADHETRAAVRQTFAVLERMPVAERLAFTLRHIDGRCLEEVASLCGCSLATIKRRLKKADKRFRALASSDPVLSERLAAKRGRP
jgi:RNA polymerase sigma-70 factor (ECF subfamily)